MFSTSQSAIGLPSQRPLANCRNHGHEELLSLTEKVQFPAPLFRAKKTVEAEGSINTPVIVKALAATQSFIFQGANFSQLAL